MEEKLKNFNQLKPLVKLNLINHDLIDLQKHKNFFKQFKEKIANEKFCNFKNFISIDESVQSVHSECLKSSNFDDFMKSHFKDDVDMYRLFQLKQGDEM